MTADSVRGIVASGGAEKKRDIRSFLWPEDRWKRRLGSLAILVLILFLAVPWPGLFYGLQVKKGQRGQALLTLPFLLRHPFSLSYTHPLYMVPVIEKFEAVGSAIHFREISTKEWGIMELYKLPGTLQQEKGEIHLRNIRFIVPDLPVTIGLTQTQRLTWEDRVYALYKMSESGKELVIEAQSISPGRYLWHKAAQLG